MYSDINNMVPSSQNGSAISGKQHKSYSFFRPQRLLLLALPLLFVSCLKEKDHHCPAEYRVLLNVKDKNYSNIGDISGLQPTDEQLAFKQYIGNLSYRLVDLGSGKVFVYVPNEIVTGNEKSHIIDFPDVPAGKYVFTVIGNTSSAPESENGLLSYNLHPNTLEDLDTYILEDTLIFPEESQEWSLDLERVKGNLTLFFNDIPDSVTQVGVQILDVYQHVNEKSIYGGTTSVAKYFTQNLRPAAILQTVLAPTTAGKVSTLRISLFSKGSTTPYMIFPDILFNSYKNKIAAFKLNVKPEGGLEIWESINGVWIKRHDMDIQ